MQYRSLKIDSGVLGEARAIGASGHHMYGTTGPTWRAIDSRSQSVNLVKGIPINTLLLCQSWVSLLRLRAAWSRLEQRPAHA